MDIMMTFAWYRHLKFKDKPLLAVILVSWFALIAAGASFRSRAPVSA
jgi:uncharacterized protein (DUF486 family)